MNPEADSGGPTNVASDSSQVDVQIAIMHGDYNRFEGAPGLTPERKFALGVRYLASGIAFNARKYITEAIMEGYRTDETVFYWILALVSERTPDELTDEDAAVLRELCEKYRSAGPAEWAEATRALCGIVEAADRMEQSDREIDVALWELDRLDRHKNELIERHMKKFVTGPMRDALWMRTVERARLEQRTGKREKRAWKFFVPNPAGPRVTPTAPPQVSRLTWTKAVAGAAVLGGAIGFLGYVLVDSGRFPQLFLMLLSLAGGALGARDTVEWRFRVMRRRAKDNEHRVSPNAKTGGRPDGFARRVTNRFDHYFAKEVPDGMEREAWLAHTKAIRRRLRDEIVDLYRERRTDAEEIIWLIRYLAGKVRTEYEKGTLYAYRTELATPVPTKTTALLGVTTLAAGGLLTLAAAITADPLRTAYALVFLILGGWAAITASSEIVLEHRRASVDERERSRELAERSEEFERWSAELKDRPGDEEMATWLEHDRNVLLDEALRHHRLSMRHVRVWTFLEAPAPTAEIHARVPGGPWRYPRYRILLFILTNDGVRQLSAHLDMRKATFHEREWSNYRYDALSAVHVDQADNQRRAFKLTLVSGEEITVVIMPDTGDETEEEQNEETAKVTLEAAGIFYTLRILEGTAAEGKVWIDRLGRRGRLRPDSGE